MRKSSHHFTLVEIILSMGIIVVCIVSVMGMFATGIKISKEASTESYSNTVLQQISGFFDKFPDARHYISETKPGDDFSIENDCKVSILSALGDSANDDTFLQNVLYNEKADDKFSLMKIHFKSAPSNREVTDFTVIARIWYGQKQDIPISRDFYLDSSGKQQKGNGKIELYDRLNIELSWPHYMPYKNRIAAGNSITFQKVLSQ